MDYQEPSFNNQLQNQSMINSVLEDAGTHNSQAMASRYSLPVLLLLYSSVLIISPFTKGFYGGFLSSVFLNKEDEESKIIGGKLFYLTMATFGIFLISIIMSLAYIITEGNQFWTLISFVAALSIYALLSVWIYSKKYSGYIWDIPKKNGILYLLFVLAPFFGIGYSLGYIKNSGSGHRRFGIKCFIVSFLAIAVSLAFSFTIIFTAIFNAIKDLAINF